MNAIKSFGRFAVVNFIMLTLLGLVLRYLHFGNLDDINYQFLLHAHSHFAFSGWIFFTLVLLIGSSGSNGKLLPGFKWVLILTLISAYGMLVFFYLQGYKPISIAFSTLLVLVSYRFTYLVFKNRVLANGWNQISLGLLKASLVFLCLSSIGPFALGPLMANGLNNTPFYQDAIYIYLHFQLNGFMLLAGLALFATTLPTSAINAGKTWLNLFIYSTVPLYFIFTLWSHPGIGFQILAMAGAGVNAVSWFALCMHYHKAWLKCTVLARTALAAVTLKVIFQVFVCIPSIGDWVFSNRDLIVGYIHLLTLGSVTPLILDRMISNHILSFWRPALWTYIVAAIIYPAILFLQPALALFGIPIDHYQQILLTVSVLFLAAGIGFLAKRDGRHFFGNNKG